MLHGNGRRLWQQLFVSCWELVDIWSKLFLSSSVGKDLLKHCQSFPVHREGFSDPLPDGQQQSTKTETPKLPNEWPQIMERSAQKCKELENKQPGRFQRSPWSILVQSSRWAKVWWTEPRGNKHNDWTPIQLHHPPGGEKDRGLDGEQPGAGSNHGPLLKSIVM